MFNISDEEIYERTVNELPFAAEEKDAKIRYWKDRSVEERMRAGDEILRRHCAKLGVDVDSLQMDKTVIHFTRLRDQGCIYTNLG